MKNNDILLIEDDARSAKLVRLMLNAAGYQVRVATNGLYGLKEAQALPPNLVLLDLMLPGIDGFEVLHQIRSDPQLADVPVVIISAKSQAEDKETANKLGVDAYLTKPYRRTELLELVEVLINDKEAPVPQHGPCMTLVGTRSSDVAPLILHLGQAGVNNGLEVLIVDLRPFSTEHARLLTISPPAAPISLAEPETGEHLHEAAIRHPSGLRLLNNLEGSGQAGQLTPKDMQVLFQALSDKEDLILVETSLYPPNMLRWAKKRCTMVLLVARGDQASRAAAHSALRMMKEIGMEEHRSGILLVDAKTKDSDPAWPYPVVGAIPSDAGPDDPAYQDLINHLQDMV